MGCPRPPSRDPFAVWLIPAMNAKAKQKANSKAKAKSAFPSSTSDNNGPPSEPAFIVDTGASFHVVNCEHVPADSMHTTDPVQFTTATGVRTLNSSTLVELRDRPDGRSSLLTGEPESL